MRWGSDGCLVKEHCDPTHALEGRTTRPAVLWAGGQGEGTRWRLDLVHSNCHLFPQGDSQASSVISPGSKARLWGCWRSPLPRQAAACKLRREASKETKLAVTLMSDFQPADCETIKLSPPVCGILLWQPQETHATNITLKYQCTVYGQATLNMPDSI